MIRDFKEMLDLEIASGRVLSKSHAKRFCRSPNSLCMGFTFLMDANTSIVLQLFYGNEVNSNEPLKNKNKILESRD